jgi:hypothetical protein
MQQQGWGLQKNGPMLRIPLQLPNQPGPGSTAPARVHAEVTLYSRSTCAKGSICTTTSSNLFP